MTLQTTRDALAALVEALPKCDVHRDRTATHEDHDEGHSWRCEECQRDDPLGGVYITTLPWAAALATARAALAALAAPPVDAGEVVREVQARLGRTALTPAPDLDDWRLAREHLAALCDLATSQAETIARLTAERDAAHAWGVEAVAREVETFERPYGMAIEEHAAVIVPHQRRLARSIRALAPAAAPAPVEAVEEVSRG